MMITPTTKTYPATKFSAKTVDSPWSIDNDFLWRLQQKVAYAKLDVMRKILDEDFVPVSDATFDIRVIVEAYVECRAIDGEATEGKWIALPVDMNYFTTTKLDRPI